MRSESPTPNKVPASVTRLLLVHSLWSEEDPPEASPPPSPYSPPKRTHSTTLTLTRHRTTRPQADHRNAQQTRPSRKPRSPVNMTSFIQTMFVHASPPQPYSPSPKPLPALHTHTNVLAESESYIYFPYPESPQSVYQSPLQRHIQNVFDSPPRHSQSSNSSLPFRQEDRLHDIHRAPQHRGLGFGLHEEVIRSADLLTRSNSNVRNRGQASFQPQKRAKGTNSWQLKQFAEATLGSGSLRKVVQLPEGEDRDEWLAVNGMPTPIHHQRPMPSSLY